MKKIILLVGSLILIALTTKAQDLTVEQILDKFYKASGYDKLQKVNTIIMSGTIIRNDAMPLKITKVRPDKYRMDFDVADITGIQAYNGKSGWSTAPWSGNAAAVAMGEDALKEMRNKADIDGYIYQYKAKGHTVQLEGTEKFENMELYKIKLTKKEGGFEFYFIDKKDFLLKKRISFRMIRGKETEQENIFKDYRIIDGIWFSFLNENKMGGQPYSTIQFETIELNKPVDNNIFEMPTK